MVTQATKDLEDIDDKRRTEFKNYELEKEHLRRKELDAMDKADRAEAEKKFDEMKKKHADHPKLHHPVCVWRRHVNDSGVCGTFCIWLIDL